LAKKSNLIGRLVRRSLIVDGLLSSWFCLRDCKIVMLTTYVTNLIQKLVVDATSLMPLQWLLQSMNGHQTCQILICLIIMCGVPC